MKKCVDDELNISFLTGSTYWTCSAGESGKIRFSDGPAGVRVQNGKGDRLGINSSRPATCFPAHSALAASWNTELCREVGISIGAEAKSAGIDILLAPDLNIKRNPLCGRNFEYFSEDPYLNGKLGAAYASGVQSAGAGACLKHFAANNRERGRMVCDSVMDERTLYELYLTAFEIAVKQSKPAAVMTAYNKINGEYCSRSTLINDVLRGEWGFEGVTVSDWGGTDDRAKGVKAGLDIEMPPCKLSYGEVKAAYSIGELKKEDIAACVERVKACAQTKRVQNQTPRGYISKESAEECCVLLKNDGALPLKGNIALVGECAQNHVLQGGGSSKVNPKATANLKDCLNAKFAPGYKGVKRSRKLENKALKICSAADTVVYCMDLPEGDAEGADRKNLLLPGNRIKLLERICALGKKVVVVLFCGCAVDVAWDSGVNALLYAGLLGQDGACAVADILTGKVNPSGKLAETFPESLDSVSSTEFFDVSPYYTLYGEGLRVGYRGIKNAKYPFGYGLSYTRFEYSDLRVDGRGAEFTLKNAGGMYGGEAAQMYIVFPAAANSTGIQLKGFVKVFLNAGGQKRVRINFDEYTFRSYDAQNKKWVRVSGRYGVIIGAFAGDTKLEGGIEIAGDCEGLPANDTKTLQPSQYKITRNKKGRVIADISTPLCELKNAKGLFGRLFAKICLFAVRNKRTEYGSIEYLPLRAMAQFGKMSKNVIEGLILMFNGKFFKGLFKMLKRERGK